MTRWIAATLAIALAFPALATDGLAWRWGDGETKRFLVRTDVDLVEVMPVVPSLNRPGRLTGFAIDAVLACSPHRTHGKKGWTLFCDFENLSVRLDPVPTEPEVMGRFAEELTTTFSEGQVSFRLLPDGRIRGIDFEGVDKFDRRHDEFYEDFRQMMSRAIAPLEVRLPPRGDDRGAGRWRDTGILAMGFPSQYGTIGRADVRVEVRETDGPIVTADVTSEGIMAPGETIVINGTERPRNQYEMTLEGTLRFDTERGVLLHHRYVARAEPTASAQSGDVGTARYVQRSEARLLEEGVAVELPPSGERATGDDTSEP